MKALIFENYLEDWHWIQINDHPETTPVVSGFDKKTHRLLVKMTGLFASRKNPTENTVRAMLLNRMLNRAQEFQILHGRTASPFING